VNVTDVVFTSIVVALALAGVPFVPVNFPTPRRTLPSSDKHTRRRTRGS